MTPEYLADLSLAATFMLRRASIAETIRSLKEELISSPEPFVWASLGLRAHDETMPPEIQSAWIFALKADTWSGAHRHPNSAQHTIVLEGRGRVRIAGAESDLRTFHPDAPAGDLWTVIEAGTTHEFHPVAGELILLSFHTAKPDELVEVSDVSQTRRHYA